MSRVLRTVLAGMLVVTVAGCTDTSMTPAAHPSPSGTGTASPAPTTSSPVPARMVNGRITSAERYLVGDAHGYRWRSFDPVSETGLYAIEADPDNTDRNRRHGAAGLAVVGRSGPVATLTCGSVLPCSPEDGYFSEVATIGPGADELTVRSGDRTAQVIGYDGTFRETIDLSATTTGGAAVRNLRWTPDGSRLAVVTGEALNRSGLRAASRVWVVDGEGGSAQLAYSLVSDATRPGRLDTSGFDRRGAIWTPGWSLTWSPDGQTLLLDVLTGLSYGADVVALHLQPDDAADPVVAQTLYHSNKSFDWWGNLAWSPDGTRIAVRTLVPRTNTGRHRVTEISAEDGRVIAQHRHNNGWLIWPAKDT